MYWGFHLELTRKETAAALGVDVTTLDDWTVKGCPASHPGKGRPASFDLQKVIAWRMEHEIEKALTRGNPSDDDREAWQTRKIAAQARLAEIEVETRKGRLVDADEITAAFDVLIIGGREHVRNIAPARIAWRAVGETPEGVVAAVVAHGRDFPPHSGSNQGRNGFFDTTRTDIAKAGGGGASEPSTASGDQEHPAGWHSRRL